MKKFNFKKLEDVINYYDIQKTFKKSDGSELTWEEIENRGMIAEEEFPTNISINMIKGNGMATYMPN